MTVLEISPQSSSKVRTQAHFCAQGLGLKTTHRECFQHIISFPCSKHWLEEFTHKLPILTAKVNTETCWPEEVICTAVSSPALNKKKKNSIPPPPLNFLIWHSSTPQWSEVRITWQVHKIYLSSFSRAWLLAVINLLQLCYWKTAVHSQSSSLDWKQTIEMKQILVSVKNSLL